MTGTHYCPLCVGRWGAELRADDRNCWRCGGDRVLETPNEAGLAAVSGGQAPCVVDGCTDDSL